MVSATRSQPSREQRKRTSDSRSVGTSKKVGGLNQPPQPTDSVALSNRDTPSAEKMGCNAGKDGVDDGGSNPRPLEPQSSATGHFVAMQAYLTGALHVL